MKKYYIYKVVKDGVVIYIGFTPSLDNIVTYQNKYCFESDDYIVEYLEVYGKSARSCVELYFVNQYKPYYNRDRKYEDKLSLIIKEFEELNWAAYNGYVVKRRRYLSAEPRMGYANLKINDCGKCYVYIKINPLTDQITYVGFTTTSLDRRIDSHIVKNREVNYKFKYLEFNSVADAALCELYYINRFQPEENKKQIYDNAEAFVIHQLDNMLWIDYVKEEYLLKNPKVKKSRNKLVLNHHRFGNKS